MRRTVLALLALVSLAALAGCAHSEGRIGMTSVGDDGALAGEASVSIDGDESRYDLAERRTIRAAIDDGSAVANDTRPPADPSLPVAYQGRYYDLRHEAVGNVSGVEFELSIDYNASDRTGTAIAYDSLPVVDRLAIRPLLVDQIDDRKLLDPGTDRYVVEHYTDAERNRSVLLDEAEYDVVTYEGERYPVYVRQRGAVNLTTYRYEADSVASSDSEYASGLRSRYAFTLSNLSEEERDVLEKASDDAFYPSSSNHQGFDALVDRFLAHDAVTRDDEHHSGSWVARYDGRLYWVELDYGSFVDDDPGQSGAMTGRETEPRATGSPIDVTPLGTDEGAATDAASDMDESTPGDRTASGTSG